MGEVLCWAASLTVALAICSMMGVWEFTYMEDVIGMWSVPAEGGRADDSGGLIGEVVGGVSPWLDAELLVWCLLWHVLRRPAVSTEVIPSETHKATSTSPKDLLPFSWVPDNQISARGTGLPTVHTGGFALVMHRRSAVGGCLCDVGFFA